MSDLERRYHRLLRAYPLDYRRSRGAEIVGTYLDLAGPDRRWPSPADAVDLVRGGLRQRLRAAGLLGLAAGARFAAVPSFLVASALAGVWSVAEADPAPAEWGIPHFGPFASLGVVAWAAWLIAVLTAALSPGRATRAVLGVALLVTVATVPASALTGLPRPPLFVLLPQVVLGAMALLLPGQPSATIRVGAPLAAIGGGAAMLVIPEQAFGGTNVGGYDYSGTTDGILSTAGGLLLAIALGMGLAFRRDSRGAWASLLLLMPIGHLWLYPLAGYVHSVRDSPTAEFTTIASVAIVVTLLVPSLLFIAVAVHRRMTDPGRGGEQCPTCGVRRRELPARP
jgi:hypothetical protein